MVVERTFEIQVKYWKKDINSNSWPELFFDLSLSLTHTTSNLKWTKSGPSFSCLRLLGPQLLPHVLCRKEAINQNRDILKRCLRYIRGKFVVKFWLNYTKFKKSNKFYRYIVRSYIPEPYHGLGWQYTLCTKFSTQASFHCVAPCKGICIPEAGEVLLV